MNTFDALYQEHKTKLLNVEDENVCRKYFGLSSKIARRYAKENRLGIRAFQIRPANGSPWFIDIEDLAKKLDSKGRF